MTIEERKNAILAKIAEMKAEGADMQNALTILEVEPDEEVENGAKTRLVEIRAAEDGEQDMRAIAASIAKLPPGQLKKILTEDILAILAKYGVMLG